MFVTIVLAVLVVCLGLFYWRRNQQINVFQSMGIPGPIPHWFTGTQTEFDKKNGFETLREWTKKYGKLYGYYEGPIPVLVTSDPDMLKEVFVKQFSNFHGRKRFPISPNPETGKDCHMLETNGNRWKRLRSIINPTFSAAKLKQITPLVQGKVDILIEKMDKYAVQGTIVDVQQEFQALTLDVIGAVAFGMEVDSQRNPDDPMLYNVKQAFAMVNAKQRPTIVYIAMLFPELRDFLFKVLIYLVKKFDKWPYFWLTEQLDKVIDLRKKEESSRKDLLQLMLDAEADEEDVKNVMMWEQTKDDNNTAETKPSPVGGAKRKLTNMEITHQSMLFLLAGYDTTSNLLSFLAHLLATNPDKQTKLQAAIDEYLQENELNDIDKLHKLPYLDMVISEALRLYPVGQQVVNRQCMEPCTVAGLQIPAGMIIQADSMTLHYNPDIWGPTDPNVFEPERFSEEQASERHPMAWIPFGMGPRNCVGMRLALTETKLTLAQLMAQYSFARCPQTREPLPVTEAATIQPLEGVFVKVVKREEKAES